MNPPVPIVDDLYWVRSDDRSDPDVLDLVTQLNATYNSHLDNTDFKQVQQELFEDMKSRVAEDETGIRRNSSTRSTKTIRGW